MGKMGRPFGSRSRGCLKREKKIIKLRRRGLSNTKIADLLKVPFSAVTYSIRVLTRGEKIEPRPSGGFQKNRQEREELIARMLRERATQQEMGKAMGDLTRQRVNQLVRGYNLSPPLPNSPYCTTPEAAKILHVGRHDIAKFCREGKLPFRRRGESSSYLIPRKDIEDVKNKIAAIRGFEKICSICGKTFIIQFPCSAKRKICSKQCFKERNRRQRAACFRSAPTVESLRGKPRILFEKLGSISCRTLPDNERWLTQAEASRETGITAAQLNWLRRRQILTTRPHPTKRWRNQPVALYAASELKIVRKVYGAV